MFIPARLSVMMFLQFFTWGAWFATLGLCLGENGLSGIIGNAYMSAPIAAMIAPLFLGLIADRFLPSQVVQGVLMLIGGACLLAAPSQATEASSGTFVWLCIAHMLCFMPTLGLANTIAFANIENQEAFPRIRVWGTIGWIVAGLTVGLTGWSASFNIFTMAGISSIVWGLYSFTLPHTPPPAAGTPVNFRTLLMADAFALFKQPAFAVFMICSTLISIPLAYYYGYTSNLLGQIGFEAPAATMTLGQMSEIFFMLLIPFFFRRLGVKWMILIGMAAWVLRYVLFAYGATQQSVSMIVFAILLHGVCYDFFFVTGFIYADKAAPAAARGQTQSLLVFLTQGVGMYFGYRIAGDRFGAAVSNYKPLNDAIAEATPETPAASFTESLGQMLSVTPPSVDPALVNETFSQWQDFWLLPAGMAAVVLVLFAIGFHPKKEVVEAAAESV